jgi:hypothetical protein
VDDGRGKVLQSITNVWHSFPEHLRLSSWRHYTLSISYTFLPHNSFVFSPTQATRFLRGLLVPSPLGGTLHPRASFIPSHPFPAFVLFLPFALLLSSPLSTLPVLLPPYRCPLSFTPSIPAPIRLPSRLARSCHTSSSLPSFSSPPTSPLFYSRANIYTVTQAFSNIKPTPFPVRPAPP